MIRTLPEPNTSLGNHQNADQSIASPRSLSAWRANPRIEDPSNVRLSLE